MPLASAASAICFVAAFPPLSLWPLMPAALSFFAWAACAAPSWRALAWPTAAAWACVWLWLQRWTFDVSEVGYPAFVVYLTAWSVVTALVLRLLGTREPTRRWPMTALLPVAWVGLETMRSRVLFDGYPWYLAEHPIAEAPVLAQAADLFGAPFVGSVVAMVAGLLVDMAPDRRRTAALRRGAAVATLLVVGGSVLYGFHRLGETDRLTPAVRVLALQTNTPQSNKIAARPEEQIADFDDFVQMTFDAWWAATEGRRAPDLVAWPETMLPGMGLEPQAIEAILATGYWPGDYFTTGIVELSRIIRRPTVVGSAAVIGLRAGEKRWEWDQRFNSVYVVGPEGALARYDKVVLTPFGERMPYISAWPWLERQLLAVGARGMTFDLDAGSDTAPLPIPVDEGRRVVHAATPICFEDTVSWLCRRMAFEGGAKRADLFLNLSNDGWFGDVDDGRLQHAQIARYRCIENRLPMVRVVNTGVTVSIDSAGRLVGAIDGAGYGRPRRPGTLLAEVSLDPRSTLYARVGDLWAWTMLALTALLAAATIAWRRPSRTTERSEP